MKNILVLFLSIVVCQSVFSGCSKDSLYLRYSLKSAGKNRSELRKVIYHYRTEDDDAQKLEAAKFLITNMMAHYSYRDTSSINSYYRTAIGILGKGPSPDWERDTLRQISDTYYNGITEDVISDVEVMTAKYLIYSIDHAFHQWRTRPWAKHIPFDIFREWILPYKVTELQSLDAWRDTLSQQYSDSISSVRDQYDNRNTIYGAIEIIRNEINSKQSSIGHRVIWEERGSLPMRSASTMIRMTYGSCKDYVTMGTAVFRSVGLPATVDQVPVWGRNNDGHSWYVFISDRGREEPTINSLIVPAGFLFFPYERIPKVWRNTYAINHDVVRYRNTAKFVYPFELCQQDVTDHYNLTSNLKIELFKDIKLKDKYAYIAMAVNSKGPQWKVLDFGDIRNGFAYFKKIGRNILYIVLGYDGKNLVPISFPFILHKNGSIDYVKGNPDEIISLDFRRKYYESSTVVEMRRRLLGGKLQCATKADFSDSITLYVIDNAEIPGHIVLNTSTPCRYWRYLSPNDSWGSISELSFYDYYGKKLIGNGVANPEAGQDAIERAFDGDLLSNFEINQPNGNWVGMAFNEPTMVKYVSIYPRGDDNDICPGNEYELLCFRGDDWYSLGCQIAKDNYLHYDNIPTNTLLWIRNHTRGNDERPFIVTSDYSIQWW